MDGLRHLHYLRHSSSLPLWLVTPTLLQTPTPPKARCFTCHHLVPVLWIISSPSSLPLPFLPYTVCPSFLPLGWSNPRRQVTTRLDSTLPPFRLDLWPSSSRTSCTSPSRHTWMLHHTTPHMPCWGACHLAGLGHHHGLGLEHHTCIALHATKVSRTPLPSLILSPPLPTYLPVWMLPRVS